MPFPAYSPDEGNGVELKNPDGLFYHGAVTDIVGPNLLIDLYTSSSSTISIPCSEAFKCRRTHMLTYEWMCSEIVYPSDVVVLLQLSRKTPWTWYPGILIGAHDGDFAIVRVNGSASENSLEVVPFDHVRFADKYLPQPVEIGVDFVKALLTIPETVKLDGKALMKLWNHCARHEGVEATGLSNGMLVVIGSASKVADMESKRFKWSNFLKDQDPEVKALQGSPRNKIITNQRLPLTLHKNFISLLPAEILHKIFSFLAVYEQVGIRCVCRRWNDFLPLCANTYPKSIWIDIDTSVGGALYVGDYTLMFGACLNKYYHEGIDTIVLSAEKDGHHDAKFLLELLTVLDKMRLALNRPRLTKLMLLNVTVAVRCRISADIYSHFLGDIATALNTVCETVVLHKVTIRISEFPGLVTNYENDNDQPSRVFDFVEINGNIDLTTPDYDKEFFNIVEAGLEKLTLEQMDQIREMIRREREADQDGIHFVYAVVESIQQCDPRLAAYHMDDISDPDLPKCLPKFNKLCLHALMKLAEMIDTYSTKD